VYKALYGHRLLGNKTLLLSFPLYEEIASEEVNYLFSIILAQRR
jgi:hypothetical protein